MIELMYPIFYAMVAAAIYSAIWYLSEVVDPTKETPTYDPFKLMATILVGACIGAASVISGIEFSQLYLYEQIAIYGMVIAGVEKAGKAIWRRYSGVDE